MLELFFVVLVLVATIRTARGRGASPWLYGSVALVGFFLLRLGLAGDLAAVMNAGGSSGAVVAVRLVASIVPYAWLGAVYLFVRSVAGRSHVQPGGQWTCPECRWLNAAAVFRCEACGHEYHANPPAT